MDNNYQAPASELTPDTSENNSGQGETSFPEGVKG